MPRRLRTSLLWLPLAALVTALVVSLVLGRGVVPEGRAASVVPVTGSVDADIYIDASGCSASSLDIGELVAGIDPWKTAVDNGGQPCAVTFGTTNHLLGTTLSMLEDPAAPASPPAALKCISTSCAGDAIGDFEDTGSEPAAGSSAFGAQLLGSSGDAAPLWNPAPAVQDVSDSASSACETTAVGEGTCNFTWGASASASDVPGDYQALARFVVLAN